MIVDALGGMVATGNIDMSALFDQMARTTKNTSGLLQHRAKFMNPTMVPRLFTDTRNVQKAVDLYKPGKFLVNVRA